MKTLKNLIIIGQIICSLAALAPRAGAQVTPTTLITISNFPPNMPGSTTSNLFTFTGTNQPAANAIINLRQGQGLAQQYVFGGQNVGTTSGNLIVLWDATVDGTNWFPVPQLGSTNAAAASTNIIAAGQNVSASVVNNMLQATVASVQNTASNGLNTSGIVGLGNVLPGAFQ
jgi:hypothetical protein